MTAATSLKSNVREAAIRNPIMPLPPAEPESEWGSDPSLVVHHGVVCNGPLCTDRYEPIRGVRYKCSICPQRDFCDNCVRQTNSHDEKHMLFECLGPAEFVEARDPNPEELELIEVDSGSFDPNVLDLRNLSLEDRPPGKYGLLQGLPEVKYVPKEGIPALMQGVKHHSDVLVDVMMGRITKYNYHDCQLQDYAGSEAALTRFLELRPGGPDDRLECTFRLARLNDTDKYEIISRAWRSSMDKHIKSDADSEEMDTSLPSFSERSHAIYVGESHFLEASPGLIEALLQLRSPKKSKTLWTEELCVDHTSKAEKNFQRRARGLIYNRADNVIVWAGKADENTESAFGLMMQLSHHCLNDIQPLPTPQEIDDDPDLPSTNSEDWPALIRFFTPDILKRRWIFEDIAFAKHVTFQCGEYRLDWPEVASIVKMLKQDEWQDHLSTGPDIITQVDEKPAWCSLSPA